MGIFNKIRNTGSLLALIVALKASPASALIPKFENKTEKLKAEYSLFQNAQDESKTAYAEDLANQIIKLADEFAEKYIEFSKLKKLTPKEIEKAKSELKQMLSLIDTVKNELSPYLTQKGKDKIQNAEAYFLGMLDIMPKK